MNKNISLLIILIISFSTSCDNVYWVYEPPNEYYQRRDIAIVYPPSMICSSCPISCTQVMGTCHLCRINTPNIAFAYCYNCAVKMNCCRVCGRSLKVPSREVIYEPDNETEEKPLKSSKNLIPNCKYKGIYECEKCKKYYSVCYVLCPHCNP